MTPPIPDREQQVGQLRTLVQVEREGRKAAEDEVRERQAVIVKAHQRITELERRCTSLRSGLKRIARHDWTEPPGLMPDEMAREALDVAAPTQQKEHA